METLAAGNSGNTGVTTGKSASSPPLLELVHISHRLVLDGVYLNGLHALRRFELRNVSSGVITVKLRSTLGAQIAFQLTNENLPDHDGDGKFLDRKEEEGTIGSLESSFSDLGLADNEGGLALNSQPPLPVQPASIPATAISSKSDPRVTTNTVAAAAIGVFGSSEQNTLHGHQFNQLFNYVNHIHEITIQPGESQKIILAFLPDTPGKSRRENGEGEAKIKVDGVANDDEKYDFFDINGLLFFFAYKGDGGDKSLADGSDGTNGVPRNSVSASDSGTARRRPRSAGIESDANSALVRSRPSTASMQATAAAAAALGAALPAAPNSNASSLSASITASALEDDFTTMTTPTNNSSTIVTSTQSSPDQEISLKFRSRVCRSVLWTDISDTGILFDDCVVGGTYSQDFTVWNRSEIDLYWIMNMVDLSNRQDNTWLKLSDYETGEPLDGSKPISSYSHQRIRLTFRPREVGEFKYDLQLENANDAGNTVSATIDAIVRAAAREECLVVSSGNVLDFGDCVTGQWAKQRIVLRNVSEMPLEIGFASEIAGVVFQREDVVHEASTVVEPDAEGIVTLEGNSGTSETTGDKLMERLRALSTTSLGQHHQLSQQQHTRHGSSDTSFVTSSAVSSRPPSPPLIAKLDSEMDQSLLLNQTKTMAIVPFMTDGLETSPPGVTMIPVLSNTSNAIIAYHGVATSPTNALATMNVPEDDPDDDAESEDSDTFERTLGEGVGTNGEEYRRIEEMILRPGNERIVEVCYRPERDPWTADYRGGRLSRRNFRITLSYSAYRARNKEKKNIQCKARTCTSFIEVNPPLINFGDTDVGTLKALPITITNMSDLAAYVELRFVSKVLNASRDPLQILPKSSMELKIEIYPRKVNPDYRKQITVVNLLNRGDNSKTVEVRSTNIDKNRVTFHSLFYRILTPTSTNFIDFGAAIINAVVVRSFTIANISKKRLVLEVETSAPDEICTYIKRKLPELDDGSKPPTVAASMASVMSSGGGVANMTSNRSSSSTHTTTPVTTTTAAAAVQRRERLLEFISDHRKLQRPEGSSTSGTTPTVTSTKVPVANNGPNNLKLLRAFGDLPDAGTSADYLDLASSVSIAKNDGRKSPRRRQHTQHFLPGTLKQLRTQFRERNKSLMNLEDLFSATSGATPTTGGLASGATPVGSSSGAGANPMLVSSTLQGTPSGNIGASGGTGTNSEGGRDTGRKDSTGGGAVADRLDATEAHPPGSHTTPANFVEHMNHQHEQDHFSPPEEDEEDDDDDHHDSRSSTSYQSRAPLSPSTSHQHRRSRHAAPQSTQHEPSSLSLLPPAAVDPASLSLDHLIQMAESATGKYPPAIPRLASEEAYVKSRLQLNRELEAAISDGRLEPVSVVDIAPDEDVLVVVIFKPKGVNKANIQTTPKKQDGRIFLKLVEFDKQIQQPQFEQLLQGDQNLIPVRELLLRSSLCRSIMDLNQKNINFGSLNKNEHRMKSIVIRNKSEAPLVYAIRKSGSIASGDIILGDGRMGVVRGFGKREVEFMFDPSLAGAFHERLTIENVMDRENDQVLSVKAQIRKPAPFTIESHSVDFGIGKVGTALPRTQYVVISNTSFKKSRTFEVRVDPEELRFGHCIGHVEFTLVEHDEELEEDVEEAVADDDVLVEGQGDDDTPSRNPTVRKRRRRRPTMMLSKETEEEIEHLEQKLKIAKRKGRNEKVKKLMEKLDNLRHGIVDDRYVEKEDKVKDKDTKDETEKESQSRPSSAGPTSKSVEAEADKVSDPSRRASTGVLSKFGINVPSLPTESSIVSDGAFGSSPPMVAASAPVEAPSTVVGASQPVPTLPPLPVAPKVKRTETSIVFTADPRTIRTVAVVFRTTERPAHVHPTPSSTGPTRHQEYSTALSPSQSRRRQASTSPSSSACPSTETCLGSVYVHEHRNTDIIKEVSFKATVCYTSSAYHQALEADLHHGHTSSSRRHEINAAHNEDGLAGGGEGAWTPSPSHGQRSRDTEREHTSEVSSGLSTPGSVANGALGLGSYVAAAPTTATSLIASLLGTLTAGDGLAKLTGLASTATDTESQRPPSPLPTLLSIDQPIIDIGNIKVNERKDCYFTLVNRNATALSYTVIPNPDDSDLQFSQGALVGTLDAKETRRVDFAIQPTTSGRSKRVIQIQNHSTQQDDLMVTFNFYALSPNYLAFPALPDPLAGSGELDLGVCYLDANKKYARIVPYQVQNVSSEDLYLAAVSNLTQQCYIFADQASETPVVDLLLKCGQQVTVYIALQPYLGGASGGSRRGVASGGGSKGGTDRGANTGRSGEEECRTLVGGIKFSVSNREEVENGKESLYHLTSYTTRFSALIGQSLLGVSSSVVDLGCAYEPGQLVTGSFEVHNVSRRLPGEFVVSCRSTEIEVDAYSGRLDGKRDGGTGDSATTSADSAGNAPTEPVLQETINFKIRCPPYGLLSEMIEIVNTHNSAQKLLVQVRHFVDRGTLKLELNNSSECETPREISTRTFPQLSWEDVYVELTRGSGSGAAAGSDESSAMVTLAKSVRDDAVPNYDQEVLVRNLKPEAVSIILSSDLNLTVKVLAAGNLLVDTAPIALCNDSEQPRASAPTITIAGLDTIRLVISVPTPASLARSDESLTSLNSGRKCSIPGICTMADSVSGTILAALDLLAWYGISRGTIEPQTLDLGKVGHFNRWNDVKFKLTLRNPVEIPLICEIILPDAVELASAAADRKPLHRVEANSSISLDATLKPRLLDQVTPGPRSVKIIGTNVYNPANAPSCSVTCQLTLFELKFERLVEGELVLPPLTHPHLPSTLPCDTWFAIVNTSEEEAKFETGCVLAPEIADYVRLDILSRFSNSPLVGSVTLAPRGSIEVRVRAYAREDSRLPPDSSALTAPEGVIFGTLCITSKQQEPPVVGPALICAETGELEQVKPDVEMEVTKMTENISIRGVLQEGQTFTVSHKRIELRSLLASDTEDEETDVISDSDAGLTHPRNPRGALTTGEMASNQKIVTPGPAIPVQRESVDIVNLSTTFPLDFKVFFEFPVDLPDAARILGVSPVDEEFCGHVDAGGKLSLDFELIDPRIGGISDDIKVLFYDCNSLSGEPQILYVSVVEDQSSRNAPSRVNENETVSSVAEQLFDPAYVGDRTGVADDSVERSTTPGLSRDVLLSTKAFFEDFKVIEVPHEGDPDLSGNPNLYHQAGIYIGFSKATNQDHFVARYVGKSANLGSLRITDHKGLEGCSLILVHFTKWPAGMKEIMLATFQFKTNVKGNYEYNGPNALSRPKIQLTYHNHKLPKFQTIEAEPW